MLGNGTARSQLLAQRAQEEQQRARDKLKELRANIIDPGVAEASAIAEEAGGLRAGLLSTAQRGNEVASKFGSLVEPLSKISADASRGQGALNPEDFTKVGGVGSVLGDVLGTPFGLLEDAQSGLGDIFGTRSGHDREKARAIIDTFNSLNPEGAIEPREFNTGNVVVDQMREWNRPESADLQYGVQKIKELRDEEARRLSAFREATQAASSGAQGYRAGAGAGMDAFGRAAGLERDQITSEFSVPATAGELPFKIPQAAATLDATIAGTEAQRGRERRSQDLHSGQLDALAYANDRARLERDYLTETFDTRVAETVLDLQDKTLQYEANLIKLDPETLRKQLQDEITNRAQILEKRQREIDNLPTAEQAKAMREWKMSNSVLEKQAKMLEMQGKLSGLDDQVYKRRATALATWFKLEKNDGWGSLDAEARMALLKNLGILDAGVLGGLEFQGDSAFGNDVGDFGDLQPAPATPTPAPTPAPTANPEEKALRAELKRKVGAGEMTEAQAMEAAVAAGIKIKGSK
ncbi:MAG: hypothetical protein P8N94_02680 [Gammaproteobacteria bacterium]|nr:hypothetical protein [Gammaproteobacteria bacterium]